MKIKLFIATLLLLFTLEVYAYFPDNSQKLADNRDLAFEEVLLAYNVVIADVDIFYAKVDAFNEAQEIIRLYEQGF